jgi:hypothetical protein
MHFLVRRDEADLVFEFSNAGECWGTAVFHGGLGRSAQLDVVRAGLVLDCVGRRTTSDRGEVWHINRDDVSVSQVLSICHRICVDREYHSTFDLTASVVRELFAQLGDHKRKGLMNALAVEVNRSFVGNAMTRGKS